jgi:putative oxidoreductase
MIALINRTENLFTKIPEAMILLFVRIAIGQVFWSSGQTKVEGFALRPEAIDLFREEYKLPFISPEIAAPMAALAEHALPALLIVGLFTRFAALGLIVMTLVIQFLVYPEAWWPVHSLWMALLLVILVRGGGSWSLDRFVLKTEV